jgi:hypothetical protein
MTFDDDVYYNCLAGESDSAGPERHRPRRIRRPVAPRGVAHGSLPWPAVVPRRRVVLSLPNDEGSI